MGTIIAIVLFSIVFNASRWFEIKTFETFDSQYNETFAILQNTELRDNLIYIQWYGMIGASIIMVFIPAVVLIWSALAMCLGIPNGNQRKKVLRIMFVIITMFIVCHVPKICFY